MFYASVHQCTTSLRISSTVVPVVVLVFTHISVPGGTTPQHKLVGMGIFPERLLMTTMMMMITTTTSVGSSLDGYSVLQMSKITSSVFWQPTK